MSYSIPSELSFEELSRMYPSQKMEYRKQCFNGSSFSSGNPLQLMINKQDRTFLNPATLSLRFRLNVSCTSTVATTTANSKVALLGNAWSLFSRYTSKQSGGSDIDQIEFPGRLLNCITNVTLNSEEKRAMVSMGYNETTGYTNFGYDIGVGNANAGGGNTTVSASFNIPIIGALNAMKLIPLFVSDIELNFVVAQINNCMRSISSVASFAITGFTIDNVEIVGDVLTLEESSFAQFLQMYPQGVINLKSTSYSYASGQSLQNEFQGTADVIVPYSLNSMKQFIWWASPTDCPCGNYDGVNPNLQNYQLFIGAQAYPVTPVRCDSVSEIYYQNSKSFGAFYSASHSGSALRSGMAKSSTADGEYSQYTNAVTVANYTDGTLANKFYNVLDLEIINQLKLNMYSGISTRGNTNSLRLNVSRKLLAGSVMNIHMYAVYDVVLNFDFVNGKITYSN